MKPIDYAQFLIGQHTQSDAVFKLLQQEFVLYETDHILLKRFYLDSFDWRMYQRNYICGWEEPAGKNKKNCEGVFFIHDKSTGGSVCELTLNGIPKFSKDVSPQIYSQLLDDALGIRALMTVAELTVRRKRLLILNHEHKTLAILQAESYAIQQQTNEKKLADRLTVTSIRGYQKVFRRIIDLVTDRMKLPRAKDELLDHLLEITGQKPDQNRAAIPRKLEYSLNAREAVQIVLYHLFKVMRVNEPGLRKAIDTEFLHDYRVAVRRIRSILGQIKHVFPGNQLAYFKREFSWLGAITTPTRDLDAYLLKFDGYMQELPQELRRDLEMFRIFLERHWKIEHERLCCALDSKRYQKMMSEWQKVVVKGDIASNAVPPQKPLRRETYNATSPASDVARRRIWRLYRRILKSGEAITPQSHDEALHELRKTCKKFRYLIEFFQDYYTGQSVKKLLKTLKQLQDNLGDFQDLCVQIQQIKGFAEQMQQEGLADTKTIMAMGVLVEKLNDRKMVVRTEFTQRFKEFVQPDNKSAFVDVLRVHEPEGITS